MGTDEVETLHEFDDIKVHRLMCTELNKLLCSVSQILPEIETARPRCSGIDALCSLTSAIDKAQLLIQQCRDSSKLYLALTGDVILKRCIKSRSLLEQCLSQIQSMVPVLLAVKISRVVVDIKGARFGLDPSEETAGKILKELLCKNGSRLDDVEEITSHSIQVAALKLHISSQTALLIEKRSIRKLHGEVSVGDSAKRKILCFFLKLLDKYGKLIVQDQKKNGLMLENHFTDYNSSSVQFTPCPKQDPQSHGSGFDISSQPVPPHQFICPLSLRVMYEPVVIASGETFERMWIQKWFDEGNDTCPKTGKKLLHKKLSPNGSLKELISKWCSANEVPVPDPNIQHGLDISCTSIASLTSSLNNLSLPMYSNSFSTTYSLDKITTKSGDDSLRFCSGTDKSVYENIYNLTSLSWESQLNLVERILRLFDSDDHQLESIQYQNLIHPLLRFLKHARELVDVKSQMSGCMLLLASVKKYSKCIAYLDDDAYDLLASFINSDVTREALLLWETLSGNELSRPRTGESSALVYILRMLESPTRDFHELLLSIICNVSEDDEISSFLISSNIISNLIPLLEDTGLAEYCARILKNMSHKEAVKVSIVETDGCIACLARLLDSDSLQVQEHTLAVLLSLCSQRVQYCHLVTEHAIPALCAICINGKDKGKAMATELLRLLRDETTTSSYHGECSKHVPDPLPLPLPLVTSKELKSPSKPPKYLGKMLGLFKPSPISAKKKGGK